MSCDEVCAVFFMMHWACICLGSILVDITSWFLTIVCQIFGNFILYSWMEFCKMFSESSLFQSTDPLSIKL